ncbi:hypothetical protein CO641_12040 [Lysobacteraceae bacterium NML91-0213]|nr:hypothetical protein CO641_12040 [Xanthomonadaceae bacterium NML91-0213]
MSFARKFIAVGLNQGVQALSQVAVIILASRLLVPMQYGIYRQYFLIYEISAAIVGFGLGQSAFYFISRSKEKKRLLWRIVGLLAITTTTGFAIVLPLAASLVPEVSINLGGAQLWLIPFTFASLLSPICLAFCLDAGKQNSFALRNAGFFLFSVLLFGLFVGLTRSLEAAVYTRIITGVLTASALFFFTLRSIEVSAEGGDVLRFRDLVAYSFPLGAATSLGVLSQYLDKLVVSHITHPEEYAIYINGAIEVPLLPVITGAIATVAFAELATLCQQNNYRGALDLFSSVARRTSLLIFPVFLFLLVQADTLLVILFGYQYAESATPFRIFLLLLPVRVIVYAPMLVALGLHKEVWKRSVVEFVLVLLVTPMIATYMGYKFAALGVVTVSYLWSVPFNLLLISRATGESVAKILPFRPLAIVFGVAALSLGPAILISRVLPTPSEFWSFIVAGVVYLLIIGITYQLAGLFSLRKEVTALLRRGI